jgi:hypothetical protein
MRDFFEPQTEAGVERAVASRVGLKALAFEYSIRGFLSLKTLLKHVGSVPFLLNSKRLLSGERQFGQ